jgi:ribonuclease Z
MKLTILGCNGAIPAYGRFPTSQVLEINSKLYLIDCGEGAQILMQQFGVKIMKIEAVFISHMHGDHYFGLIGLLNTMSLLGRERLLEIFAPAGLEKIIRSQIDFALSYELHFVAHINNISTILINSEKLEVNNFPVQHSIPTHGFKFTLKYKKRVVNPDLVKQFEIPKYFLNSLADGKDYEPLHGEKILNEWVTSAGKADKTYAYCADTAYSELIIPYINSADLLYHESTYIDEDIDKATTRLHSTASQAATIALLAKVKRLIIGHYSSKYKDPLVLHQQAIKIFDATDYAEAGKSWDI